MSKEKFSKCCGAPVWTGGEPDAGINANACTRYYICSACGEPCNIITDSKKDSRTPIAKFLIPVFETMKEIEEEKMGWVYFYTIEEAREFLNKAPKEWLIEIILNNKNVSKNVETNKRQKSIQN